MSLRHLRSMVCRACKTETLHNQYKCIQCGAQQRAFENNFGKALKALPLGKRVALCERLAYQKRAPSLRNRVKNLRQP